jgi:hypothetical protein
VPRIARSCLKHLERLGNIDGPPVGRLLFLIPDLWPEDDRRLFEEPHDLGELGDLVERRTGVRSTFGMAGFWAITVPASDEMLAMTDDDKAAYLEEHETRPLKPGQWEWRTDANGGRGGDAWSPSPGGSARSRSGNGCARPTRGRRT